VHVKFSEEKEGSNSSWADGQEEGEDGRPSGGGERERPSETQIEYSILPAKKGRVVVGDAMRCFPGDRS